MLKKETVKQKVFLSTPSARRATLGQRSLRQAFQISIHALREEGDQRGSIGKPQFSDFYPRPPRGGRLPTPQQPLPGYSFLSTPSARRATPYTIQTYSYS